MRISKKGHFPHGYYLQAIPAGIDRVNDIATGLDLQSATAKYGDIIASTLSVVPFKTEIAGEMIQRGRYNKYNTGADGIDTGTCNAVHSQYVSYRESARDATERNTQMLVWAAKQFRGKGVGFPRLLQQSFVFGLHAADRFDNQHAFNSNPDGDDRIQFQTYLGDVLRKCLSKYIKTEWDRRDRARGRETEEDGEFDMDMVTDFREVNPASLIAESVNFDELEVVLKVLNRRELDILYARFGLGEYDGQQLTLADLGRKYGIKGERIRQIEAKAIKKITQRYNELYGDSGASVVLD